MSEKKQEGKNRPETPNTERAAKSVDQQNLEAQETLDPNEATRLVPHEPTPEQRQELEDSPSVQLQEPLPTPVEEDTRKGAVITRENGEMVRWDPAGPWYVKVTQEELDAEERERQEKRKNPERAKKEK